MSPSARKKSSPPPSIRFATRGKNKSAEDENAKFLADTQGKLRDQSRSLANRMKSRELAQQNAEFQSFAKDMEQAAQAMNEAVDKLKAQGLEGRDSARAEGIAVSASRGSHPAPDTGCLRAQGRRRWRRRRRSRPGKPLRPRTRHREESVRDGNAVRFRRSANKKRPTKHCRNWNSWRVASRSSRNNSATSVKARSSAGSRRCCGAKRKS